VKNELDWKESKYTLKGKDILASSNSSHLSPQSWLMANCIARCYQEAFPRYCRGHLLDMGCGKVPYYKAYKPYVSECTCIDWPNSLHSNIHLDMECDLNGLIPLDNNKYNTILMSDVLEHIYNPHQLLSECQRIMKRNGYLLMNVPYMYWIHEQPFDFYRYTKYALLRMAEDAGFRVCVLQAIGGGLEVFADITAKCAAVIPIFGGAIGWIAQHFVWHFSRTRQGKALLQRSSELFPLGYFCVFQKTSNDNIKL